MGGGGGGGGGGGFVFINRTRKWGIFIRGVHGAWNPPSERGARRTTFTIKTQRNRSERDFVIHSFNEIGLDRAELLLSALLCCAWLSTLLCRYTPMGLDCYGNGPLRSFGFSPRRGFNPLLPATASAALGVSTRARAGRAQAPSQCPAGPSTRASLSPQRRRAVGLGRSRFVIVRSRPTTDDDHARRTTRSDPSSLPPFLFPPATRAPTPPAVQSLEGEIGRLSPSETRDVWRM